MADGGVTPAGAAVPPLPARRAGVFIDQQLIPLRRESWTPPDSFAFGEAELKPLRAGEALAWRVV